jgi:hypothetical protein
MPSDRGADDKQPSPWRAILIGLAFSFGGFYFGMYGYQIVQVLHWSTTSLQLGSVLVLFFVTVLAAPLGRLRSALRLRPSELLIVFTISTITTSVGGHGMVAYLIPMLPAPRYYATPENNWDTLFEHVPRWLTVNDPAAVEAFYEANGTLYSIDTLRAWAVPLSFWLLFATLLVVGTWAFCNLVSEQWVSRERLTFPLAQLPLAMAGAGPYGAFWSSRLMWLGFAIPMVLQSFNFVNYLYPTVPSVWLKARPVARSLSAAPWTAIKPLHIAFYPFVIGVVFMLSLETSFSCWFFYWITKAERVLCAAAGLRSSGEGAGQLPLANQQGTGALLALVTMALVLAWRGMRQSARIDRPEGVQVISTKTSLAILAAALVGLVGLSSSAGLPVILGLAFFLLRWLIALAWARVAAETGTGWTAQNTATVHQMLIALAGTKVLRPSALPMFATFDNFDVCADSWAVQLLAAHKYREVAEIPRVHLRNATIVGIVGSVLWTAWTHLDIYYRHGAAMAKMRGWYTSRSAQPWRILEGWILRPRVPDPWQIAGYVGGGGIALLLRLAMFSIPSWPLHPIGYALAHTDSMHYMWMPFLIAWLLKSLVLRYGGVKVYQRLVPFFMGLILGDVVVAGLWGIYGVSTGRRMFMHFPH